MTETLLIWWTNQADCELVDALFGLGQGVAPEDAWPAYLVKQYSSRSGRNGRARLWSDKQFKHDGVDPWPDNAFARMLADHPITHQSHAGIVIRAIDAGLVGGLPGVVTTMTLDLALPPFATKEKRPRFGETRQ